MQYLKVGNENAGLHLRMEDFPPDKMDRPRTQTIKHAIGAGSESYRPSRRGSPNAQSLKTSTVVSQQRVLQAVRDMQGEEILEPMTPERMGTLSRRLVFRRRRRTRDKPLLLIHFDGVIGFVMRQVEEEAPSLVMRHGFFEFCQ